MYLNQTYTLRCQKLNLCLTGNTCEVTVADFQLALCHIVPSMYRGLEGMVELQPVNWDEIGGLKDVKQALTQVGVILHKLDDPF